MIIEPSAVPAFAVATLAILLAPGPDMMFMIGTGLSAGRRGAVVAALGVTSGVTIYVLGSAIGLAALLEQVPQLLDLVRLLGAAYLVRLAWTAWHKRWFPAPDSSARSENLGDIFRRGFTVNITNPKVAIFIAAFIPHFVNPDLGHTTAQFVVFGATFQFLGLLVDLLIGTTAGSTRHLVLGRPNAALALDRISAGVYLSIAAWLVAEQFI